MTKLKFLIWRKQGRYITIIYTLCVLRKVFQKTKELILAPADLFPPGASFRSVKTQAHASVIQNVPEGLPRALLAIVTHLYEVVVS